MEKKFQLQENNLLRNNVKKNDIGNEYKTLLKNQ